MENGRLVTTCKKVPKYLKTSIIHVVYEAGYYQLVINTLGRNSFGDELFIIMVWLTSSYI